MWTVKHITGTIAAAFGIKSGRTRRPAPTRNRVRLALESLDLRLPPSSLLNTEIFDPTVVSTQPKTDAKMALDADDSYDTEDFAPRVMNFVGVQISGSLFRLSGDVIDVSPGGLTIAFGGEPESLQGLTVMTDANGHFEKSLDLKTDGSDTGTASAQTVNAAGFASNVALTMVHPS